MARTGVGFVAVVAIGVVLALVIPALTRGVPPDRLVFVVDTPRLGMGVEDNTPVVLNGVRVGKVREIKAAEDGGASMRLDLDRKSVIGLRQNFSFDYRPQNYFGVTAVTIADTGRPGSSLVETGDRVRREQRPDYTMGTMIEHGSDFVNDSLEQPMTDSIKRVLAYSAALEPLIHTGVVVADTVARTQQALPAELIHQYNQIAQALTPFAAGTIDGAYRIYNSDLRPAGEQVRIRYAQALKEIADNFFTLVGSLLKSNQANLSSTVQIVSEMASILPSIGQNALTPMTLATLVKRLDGAFAHGSASAPTLRVRVYLDKLPILQSPVAAVPNHKVRPH